MVSVILLLMALRWLPQTGAPERASPARWFDAVVATACGVGTTVLVYAVLTRPTQSIAEYYLRTAVSEAGGANAVNVIIVDYRGLDTLGEITVFAVAGLIIYAMLKGTAATRMAAPPMPGLPRHSLLLQTVAQVLLPLAIAVSLYLFLRGHNLPGGGFIGALVLAVALLLQYIAAGSRWCEQQMAPDWHAWIGWGLMFAAATGGASFLFGFPFLTSSTPHLDLPWIGTLHLPSAMGFDTGVYLTIFGATVLMLSMLGRLRAERQAG